MEDCGFQVIRGIGVLAVYDIAHQIGVFFGLNPEKVYLHAGANEGAKSLGINCPKGVTLEMDELPREFEQLKLAPEEAEDFLCIFKNELKKT